MTPDPGCPATKHGTVSAYNKQRCRCEETCRIKLRQEKRRRLTVVRTGAGLWIDGTGTTRRLRALSALGYSTREMAAGLDSTQLSVRRWIKGGHQVHASSAERVRALYDRWSMTPGRGAHKARTIKWAKAQGFAVPLAWDEDSIDDPTAQPSGLPCSQKGIKGTAGTPITWDHLRWADVDMLRGAGEEDAQIAARFGITVMALHKAERRRSAGQVAA